MQEHDHNVVLDMDHSWATSPTVRAIMRGNTSRDTKPELRIRRLIHAAGLRYRKNFRPLPNNRATADLVFTRVKVAVFVDGCFWHGCPDHYRPATKNAKFWEDKRKETSSRDARINVALKEAGWTVIRVWEHVDPILAAEHIKAIVGHLRVQECK